MRERLDPLSGSDSSEMVRRRADLIFSLTIGDRQMDTDCLVGPPGREPLMGQLVLDASI